MNIKIFAALSILIIAILACSNPTAEPTVSENIIQTAIAGTRTAEAGGDITGEITKEATRAPDEVGEITSGNEVESLLPTAHLGIWEIALDDFEIVADFNGRLPEEGHQFHAINIEALNRSDKPQYFTPGVLGSFKAVWEEFSYPSIGFDSLEGYVPPGWPINAKIILDIPSIVENPIYILQPKGVFDDSEQIELNNLGSDLFYEKPMLKNLGEVFEIPDKVAITPDHVRTLLINYGNYNDDHLLLLDSTVESLYGHDITLNLDTKFILQLYSAGRIIPITDAGYEYSSPGSYPNFGTKWYAPPPESISRPFDNPRFEPIAPGIVRQGSFWLNMWGQSEPPKNMILLIMHEVPAGFSSEISEWALFKLSDSAERLLDQPIAKPDLEHIALIEAQGLIDDGNWAAAAVVLGNAKINNPGNIDISNKLEEAQQFAGQLISKESERIFSSKIGSDEKKIFFEGSQDYDMHVSPDGNKILYFDPSNFENIFVVDKITGQEKVLTVKATLDSPTRRWFSTWSPTSEKFILLDSWLSQNYNLIIVDLNNNTTKELTPCEEAPIDGLVAWSPTDEKIAYYGEFRGRIEGESTPKRARIVVMDLNTKECKIIHTAEDSTRMDWWSPKLGWSSDGNSIFFGFENQFVRLSLTDLSIKPLSPVYYENIEHIYMGFDERNIIFDVFHATYLFDTKTNEVYRIENEIDSFALRNWVP